MGIRFISTAALFALAGSAFSQPFFVRGDFNSWGTSHQMNLISGNHYQLTVSGLTANSRNVLKVGDAGWTNEAPGPGGNLFVHADADGTVTIDFWNEASWSDGWLPNRPRVGYTGGTDHAWEVMGSFNGWANPFTLTNVGGVWTGTITAAPGSYEFKFRKTNDWDISIGNDFRGNDGNIAFTQPGWATSMTVELDVPNGRYRVQAVPEPATMLALAGGLSAVVLRRRRRA